ncbi:MAG: hypothetical protein KA712_12710 [Myxococcales bacterium]|nr:hypothetical protein [Myxococcales bacterium]
MPGALEAVDKALVCQLEGEALGQLRLLEARVSYWLGNAERAEGAARDAEGLLTGVARLEAVGELVVSLGCLVFEKGRGDREDDFRQWFERLRTMPESTLDPSRHNSALFRAGTYLFSSSDAKRWGWIEDLARLQRDQAAPACRAAALNVLSWAAALRSQWETSSELARCAADDFATAGNMQESLINRENAAVAMGVFGALEEAVKLSRDVVREASRHSGPLTVNSASANLAHLLLEAGHFEEAASVAEQCAQLCARHGHQRLEPFAWCTAARARLALNDFARAEESCLRAEASVAPSSPLVSVARAVRVRLLLSSGSQAEAASAAQEMLESVDRLTASDFSSDEVFVWATAALAFQEIKDEANLRHCINECLTSVEKRFRVSAGGVVGPEAAMRLSELEGLPASALPKMG